MLTPSPRRYLYLMGDGLQATVIDSQVITILRRLAERGVAFELVSYQPRPRGDERARVRARAAALAGELRGRVSLWDLPSPGALVLPPQTAGRPAAASKPRAAWRDTAFHLARRAAAGARDTWLELRLVLHLLPSLTRGDDVVVHARGGAMAVAARLKRWSSRVRFVADFRGDRPAEYLYKMTAGGGTLSDAARREHARLRAQDKVLLGRADAVQCVSDALRRRLEREHGPLRCVVRTVPCAADETRFAFDPASRARLRLEHGWTEKRVLVYSGSMLAWQQPEAVLALFARLNPQRPETHLLLLTPEVDRARALAGAQGLKDGADVTIRAARHDEVAPFLSASDVALLLRERHPLNEVASPTKFAEYVLCGLPVLVSQGVGDLERYVEPLELGVLVGDHRDPAEIDLKAMALLDGAGSEERPSRSRRAAPVFALGAYLDAWARFYQTL